MTGQVTDLDLTHRKLARVLNWAVNLSLGLVLVALAWSATGGRAAALPDIPTLGRVVPALGRGEAWAIAYLGILMVLVTPIAQSLVVWLSHRAAAPRRLGLLALALLTVQVLAIVAAAL